MEYGDELYGIETSSLQPGRLPGVDVPPILL